MPRGFAGEERREAIERENEFQQRMAGVSSAPMNIDPVTARAVADAVQLNLSRAPAYGSAPQPFDRQETAFSGGVPMGPTIAPPLMFGEGNNMQGPRAPGQAAYPIAYSTFTPGQRGSLNEYLMAGPGNDPSLGVGPALMRLLGAKTRYEQLSSGDYRPVFVGDDLYGSFGEGPFGGMVYTGRTLPPDVAAEYGIPGYDAPGSDDSEAVVAPVVDPVTNAKECPEGYIFDEDLQACRLDTSAPVPAALEPRTPVRTYGLLEQAPDGLLEFQRRYGIAPSTGNGLLT